MSTLMLVRWLIVFSCLVVLLGLLAQVSSNPRPTAAEVRTSAVEVLTGANNYFLKVNLQDSRVRFRVGLANNDAGGYETLAGMKNQYSGKGYAEWAVINGDYFGSGCSSNVNCAQGLTYIDGARKDNWSAYGMTWEGRGNLGFGSAKDVQISVGNHQTKRHMVIAGGPWIVKDGGSPTCSAQYVNGKTHFSTGEQFDGDQTWWCTPSSANSAITMVGYSSDRQHLYMGVSSSGMTLLQLAQWLKDRGAHDVLKLDGGGSSGIYHNGTRVRGSDSRPIANSLALIVDNAPPPTVGNGIELCDGENYGQPCKFFAEAYPEGKYSDLNSVGFWDRAESIRFVGECTGGRCHAVLHSEKDFQGDPGHYDNDAPVLGNAQKNHVRSVTVYRNQPPSCNPNADQVALYVDTNYGGSCVTLNVGQYANPGALGSLGNDTAESIRAGSNVRAILYEHADYQGRSDTFSTDDSNLGDNYIGGNSVSSVKVELRQPPTPTPTPTPVPTSTPTPVPTATPTATPASKSIVFEDFSTGIGSWWTNGNVAAAQDNGNGMIRFAPAAQSSAEASKNVGTAALSSYDMISLRINLHGTTLLDNDASALYLDQGGNWKYVSLSNYVQEGMHGWQTATISLNDFQGFDKSATFSRLGFRFWVPSASTIDVDEIFFSSKGTPTPTPTPTPTQVPPTATPTPVPVPTNTPTPTPTPVSGCIELLKSPWHLEGTNAQEAYQNIASNILQGRNNLKITYNLHGLKALSGDASAIIFDQGGWRYISLSNYGNNGLDGVQTVTIPLSAFGLDLSQPVGTLHTRFWYSSHYVVDISSIAACN